MRSALGRLLAIAGLIAITGILGYVAISVPEGSGFGNMTFLLIMVGLTLVAVVANVLHPVAWTREEFWTAVLSPLVAGGIVVLVAAVVFLLPAFAERGVAHISIPVDFQERPVRTRSGRSERNIAGHVSDVASRGMTVPCREDLERAAEILNAGKRVVILAGRGALGAGEELERVAETLGAPIVKALLGKAVVPDVCLYITGGI